MTAALLRAGTALPKGVMAGSASNQGGRCAPHGRSSSLPVQELQLALAVADDRAGVRRFHRP